MKQLNYSFKGDKYLYPRINKIFSFENKMKFIESAMQEYPQEKAYMIYKKAFTCQLHKRPFNRNDVKTTENNYLQALSLTTDPDLVAQIYNRLAQLFGVEVISGNRLRNAEKHLKYLLLAYQMVPDDTGILRNLGEEYIRREKYDKAEKYFSRLDKLEPGKVFTHYYFGVIAAQKNDIETAMKFYHKVLKKKRDNLYALLACRKLLAIYYSQADYKNIIFCLKIMRQIFPDENILFSLGNYHFILKDILQAHRYWTEAVTGLLKDKTEFDLDEIPFASEELLKKAVDYFEKEKKKEENSLDCKKTEINYVLYLLYEALHDYINQYVNIIPFLESMDLPFTAMILDKKIKLLPQKPGEAISELFPGAILIS